MTSHSHFPTHLHWDSPASAKHGKPPLGESLEAGIRDSVTAVSWMWNSQHYKGFSGTAGRDLCCSNTNRFQGAMVFPFLMKGERGKVISSRNVYLVIMSTNKWQLNLNKTRWWLDPTKNLHVYWFGNKEICKYHISTHCPKSSVKCYTSYAFMNLCNRVFISLLT